MKRSLFIAIAVLIVMALFVGCKAEIADRDELVEVTIDGGSRALTATGTMDVDADDLYWYFSATKNSGLFKVGETEWKAVQSIAGISGASLGQFSKGSWTFCFYGFTESDKTAADKAAAVYYQEGLGQNISGQAVTLTVSLTKGVLPPATIEFTSEGITWTYAAAGAGLNLEMEILGGTTAVVVGANNATRIPGTDAATAGSYVFTLADSLDLLAGNHEFTVNVFNIDGTDEELVGQTKITIVAVDGMKYVVSGNVEISDELTNVTIGGTDAPVVEAAPVVILSSAPTVVETNNTPANATNAKTSVSFPQGALDSNTTLTIETSSSEAAANSAFQVSAGNSVVAAINLSLADGTTNFKGEEVTITTYIEKNLDGVAVHYNGTGDAPTLVSYDPDDGKLVFKTTHFSEYYVTSKSVAKIGEKAYPTFAAAFAAVHDGETITLLQNTEGYIDLCTGGTVTIDVNGTTFTGGDMWITDDSTLIVDGSKTGSKVLGCFCVGYSTPNNNNGNLVINGGTYQCPENDTCLHINGTCLDSDVTIRNATIISPNDNGIQLNGSGTFLIENSTITGATAIYVKSGNLTINGGTYTGNMAPANYEYNGNGSNATGDAIVIDSCGYPGGAPVVTINEGTFWGTKNAVGYYRYEKNGVLSDPATITINWGMFTACSAEGKAVAGDLENVKIRGGYFSTDPTDYVPTTGYFSIANSDESYIDYTVDEDERKASYWTPLYCVYGSEEPGPHIVGPFPMVMPADNDF